MSTSPPDDRRTPDDLTEYERDQFPHGIPESQPRYPEGGADTARSALTLRLVLATFGLVICAVFAVLALLAEVPLVFPIALAVANRLNVDQFAATYTVYPSLSGSLSEAARQLHEIAD